MNERIQKTIKALTDNRMDVYYCETGAEAKEKALSLIMTDFPKNQPCNVIKPYFYVILKVPCMGYCRNRQTRSEMPMMLKIEATHRSITLKANHSLLIPFSYCSCVISCGSFGLYLTQQVLPTSSGSQGEDDSSLYCTPST